MKRILFIAVFLLLACMLASCALPAAIAMDFPIDLIELPQEDEPVEVEKERLPKLATLDGLAVSENGEYFSWDAGSYIKNYQVRIAGLDRVRRTIVDYNYKVKAATPYFLLPALNQGEYFLLVKANSNNREYLGSDWAVMEYRIDVEVPSGNFEECHNDWSGFYRIFESTEDTEGLEARFCFTCLKSHVLRNPVLPSAGQWMIFTPINGCTEYSVRAQNPHSELLYEDIAIPAYFKDKPVTKIESFGFHGMPNLKTVTIPDTINKVDYGAFSFCHNLHSFYFDEGNDYFKFDSGCLIENDTNKIVIALKDSVIPDYITNIGARAFSGLKIKSIFIPAGVNEIGENAFTACDELESIVFEKGSQLEWINFYTFGGCTKLKDISLPSNIKGIDDFAFCFCTSIKNLTIPASCTYIGALAFEGWGKSQTINIKAFSSQSEADNAFGPNWNTFDRNKRNPGPKIVFSG